MPNDPVVTFQIDDSILTPKIGQILLLKFEDYITDPEEWELADSTLENDDLVKIESKVTRCG